MATDEHTGRWPLHERARTVSDALPLLRSAVHAVREAHGDAEPRRRLRAIAGEHGLWDELVPLLADEARAHADHPDVAAVFYEELADAHDNLDQPLEAIAAMEALIALAPDVLAHRERLAWLYRQIGAWDRAADALEAAGSRAPDGLADAALLAAARLNREHGRLDRAAALYRAIVARRPADLVAWRALDDVLCELGRWREVAEVRAERAERAPSRLEKAALLRAQARALSQAGDLAEAGRAVTRASTHAPEDVSAELDQAEVLARGGRGAEAAAILRARIDDARGRGAAPDDLAALQLRLAQVLEDACDDRTGAMAVLDALLAEVPAHLPALERITALAATDPDPRVHATALMRYAAAVPGAGERAAYVAAAGRRLLDAGDVDDALEAFEHAATFAAAAGGDPALQQELADLRTAAQVEVAAAAARAGDRDGAARRLREILVAAPHHVPAHLALVELLTAAGRADAAAEHLREAVAAWPAGAPAASAARLVHRLAQVLASQGDADEAHQLLHEAHRLDRGSLALTLALGDSCFQRRLWRQAALHLGAAAEHPDAPRHAAAVAAGLVRAAQAEVRALRPGNAGRHYEAAVRLDPGCAAAWHALAELATERGELARAADCLEREAAATTESRDRLRLFDALGDMALDVLGDPARAERCWRQLGDLADARALDKLLALQRRRGATGERAETCARRARLEADPAARRALLVEAAEAQLAGGARDAAVALVEEVLAAAPRDPEAVVWATTTALAAGEPRRAATWSRRLMPAGPGDELRAGLELVVALGVPLSDDDRRALAAHAPRPMASDEAYGAALSDDDLRALVDDPAERPLRDVLALLGEALPLVSPGASAALLDAGLPDAVRVTASSAAATAALYPQIARALGGPPTLLYATPHADEELALLFATPPVVVIGPRLASVRASSHGEDHAATDAALRFRLGRLVELSRPHRVFTAMPDDALARLVAGLRHGFGPPARAAAAPDVVAEAERLRTRLSVAQRQRMTECLAAIAPDALDPHAYVAACHRAADRAGLLACGDVSVAVALAGGARAAPHLLRVAASRRYLVIRKKLRPR